MRARAFAAVHARRQHTTALPSAAACVLPEQQKCVQEDAAVCSGAHTVTALLTWPEGQLAVDAADARSFEHVPDSADEFVLSAPAQLRQRALDAAGVPLLRVNVVDCTVEAIVDHAAVRQLEAQLQAAGVPLADGRQRGEAQVHVVAPSADVFSHAIEVEAAWA
jgi:hypothetical protein